MKLKIAGILFSVVFAFVARAEDSSTPEMPKFIENQEGLEYVCVAPLIETHWSDEVVPQTDRTTPLLSNMQKAKYGDGAIALAQLLNYYQYPAATTNSATNVVYYVEPRLRGGVRYGEWTNDIASTAFDWDKLDGDNPDREELDKLLACASYSIHTRYDTTGSSAFIENISAALYWVYGFSSTWFYQDPKNDEYGKTIVANLEVGSPVPMYLQKIEKDKEDKEEVKDGRIVIADGYGYTNNTLYVHLNMGNGGKDDGWYTMPISTNGFNRVKSMLVNVSATRDEDYAHIVMGRIVDQRHKPIEGASIEVLITDYLGKITDSFALTTGPSGTWATNMVHNNKFVLMVVNGYMREQFGEGRTQRFPSLKNTTPKKWTVAEEDEKKWEVFDKYPGSRFSSFSDNLGYNFAFDYIMRDPTVRITRQDGAEIHEYATLDRALEELQDDDVVEIFAPTFLEKPMTIKANCTICVLDGTAAEKTVDCFEKNTLTIQTGARVLFQNVAMTNESNWAAVKVEEGATAALKGDLALSITLDGESGIEVAGAITNRLSGIRVKVPNPMKKDLAYFRGRTFGVWTCGRECQSTAPEIAFADNIGSVDNDLFGRFYDDGVLAWDYRVDETTRSAKFFNAAGEEVGIGYSRLDAFLQDLSEGREGVTGGGRLVIVSNNLTNDHLFSQVFALTNALTICSETEVPFTIVPGFDAGFEIQEGGSLVLSNVVFQGLAAQSYKHAPFDVKGGSLVLDSGATLRKINTISCDFGAVLMEKGETTMLPGSRIEDCRAQGGSGGAIYAQDGVFKLAGGRITVCQAASEGGGVYVAETAKLVVSGDPIVDGNKVDGKKNNLEVADGAIEIGGPLKQGAKIGFTSSFVQAGETNAVLASGVELTPDEKDSARVAFVSDGKMDLHLEWDDNALVWVDTPIVPSPDWPIRVVYPDGTVVTNQTLAEVFSELKDNCEIVLTKDYFLTDLLSIDCTNIVLRSEGAEAKQLIYKNDQYLIRVKDGASLTVSNVVLIYLPDPPRENSPRENPLIDVQGGALTLASGACVASYLGLEMNSSALYIDEGGSFVMEAGAVITNCYNTKHDPNSYYGVTVNNGNGAAVLVEKHSSATFLGGVVSNSNSYASDGGAVAILGQSTASVAGDVRIEHFVVEDLSNLYLAAPLAEDARITRMIGFRADTNLVAYVENWREQWDADALTNDARRFVMDLDPRVHGFPVTNETEDAIIVWSTSIAPDGSFEAADGMRYFAVGEVPPPDEDPVDPPPPPPPPAEWTVVTNHPTPIAFKSIDRVSDTEWALVVTDRVEYCNYRLLWTKDLTKGFTSTGNWEQAHADGPWATNVITSGGAWFWRAEGMEGTNMVPPQVEN